MIQTVPIPTGVSRMGCTPGGDCCDQCRSHKPKGGQRRPPIVVVPAAMWGKIALGATPDPDHRGFRNIALRSHLGQDLQCDQDGNCYMDGTLISAPLTTGAGCAPGVASCAASTSNWLMIGGLGLLGVILLSTAMGGGGRRR